MRVLTFDIEAANLSPEALAAAARGRFVPPVMHEPSSPVVSVAAYNSRTNTYYALTYAYPGAAPASPETIRNAVLARHRNAASAAGRYASLPDNPQFELYVGATEQDLLRRLALLLKSADVDIVADFNGGSFDWPYLLARDALHGLNVFRSIGRFVPTDMPENASPQQIDSDMRRVGYQTEPRQMHRSEDAASARAGGGKYKRPKTTASGAPTIPGCCVIDMYVKARNLVQAISYKLDALAETYCGIHKLGGVEYVDIGPYFVAGGSQLDKLLEYNTQDAAIVMLLLLQLNFVELKQAVSYVTFTPMTPLLEGNSDAPPQVNFAHWTAQQQDMVFFSSQPVIRSGGFGNSPYRDDVRIKYEGLGESYYEKARDETDVSDCPGLWDVDLARGMTSSGDAVKSKGAVVIEADKSVRKQTATYDYRSLYPNVMVTYHICMSSIVKKQRYMNLPGFRYVAVKYGTARLLKAKAGSRQPDKRKHHFYVAVPDNDSVPVLSIIPRMQVSLAAMRKEYRVIEEKSNAAGDKRTAKIYNQRQLAVKLLMNSLYGATSFEMGHFYYRHITAAVTCNGRKALRLARRVAATYYDGVYLCRRKATSELVLDFGPLADAARAQYESMLASGEVEDVLTMEGKRIPLKLLIFYGDTDSIFVDHVLDELPAVDGIDWLTDILAAQSKVICRVVSEAFKPLAVVHGGSTMGLEFEKIFEFIVMPGAKKTYWGMKRLYLGTQNQFARPEMASSNVNRRKDTAPFLKDMMKEVMAAIGNTSRTLRENYDEAMRTISAVYAGINNRSIPLDLLAQSKSMRAMSGYSGDRIPIHAQAAEHCRKRTGRTFAEGEKIRFIVVAGQGNDSSRARELDMMLDKSTATGEKPDWDYYREKVTSALSFFQPLREMFGPKQRSIATFFTAATGPVKSALPPMPMLPAAKRAAVAKRS
jgi:DNA polymerase elongation subunit (family B)